MQVSGGEGRSGQLDQDDRDARGIPGGGEHPEGSPQSLASSDVVAGPQGRCPHEPQRPGLAEPVAQRSVRLKGFLGNGPGGRILPGLMQHVPEPPQDLGHALVVADLAEHLQTLLQERPGPGAGPGPGAAET